MPTHKLLRLLAVVFVLGTVLPLILPSRIGAQGQGGNQAPPPAPEANAPEDLTGYWVSLVTQDWRYRMLVPPKGDFGDIPMNPEGRKVMGEWDPSKDEEANGQCKAYGAPAIMTVPERLHIQWKDDYTLQVETSAGMQTRLFHFGAKPTTNAPQLQGYSVASWEGLRPRNARPNNEVRDTQTPGYLKVMTTDIRPGYLRKNGVPFSGNVVLEEDLDRITEPNGDTYLIDTIIINDPQYLTHAFVNTIPFRLLPNNSGWNPTPCDAK